MKCLLSLVLLAGGCASGNHDASKTGAVVSTAPSAVAVEAPSTQPVHEDPTITGTETIVFFRHGEKPAQGLGQLTPQGLNRAISLSKVLPAKYGQPDYLFAPDPADTRVSENKTAYFYIRPLATIEPLAISLGMPVQTPFGFAQIDKLNAELTSPKYAHSMVFVAWEHGFEAKAVISLIKQYGGDATVVPKWRGSDYDSLYVVKIIRVAGVKPVATFTHEQEGLDHLSTMMPIVPASQPTTNP